MEENQTLPDHRPPTPYHIWDGGEWLLPEVVRETARYWAAAEKWEEIKQKRHANRHGGVFVDSIGKWFHSTEEARQKYTFMRTLTQLPPDLVWSTMDGEIVKFTRELLDELSLKMLTDEQKDFANARQHKKLLGQSPEPWNYDYSGGWMKIYQEGL